jgi:hypothetical protein
MPITKETKRKSILRSAAARTRPNRYRDTMKHEKPRPITLAKTPWDNKPEPKE